MFARIRLAAVLLCASPALLAAQTPAVSVTQKGPATAPVTIVEYSDFECPFCARMPDVLKQILDEYPDQIRLIFKHSPLPIHPAAPLAHEAALAAAAQGKFWEMHDLLFANQKQLSRADLDRYAQQLGLDMAAFGAAMDGHGNWPVIEQDMLEARAYGIDSTPTFFINGRRHNGQATYAVLKGYVDAALGRSPVTTSPMPTNEPRVGQINVDGAPVRGAPDAPVTIVEFSDLQCPFCAQTTPVLQQIVGNYDGKVKWIFKNFPLSIHANAMLAHQAAMAAEAQGKFWQMHDALFADQKGVNRSALLATAGRLGLNVAQFAGDLDKPAFKTRIENERTQGLALGVGGTPTLFINGRRLVGAKSYPEMKAIIDQELVGRPLLTEDAAATTGPADVTLGSQNAPITLTWFSDVSSSLTPKATALVNQVLAANAGKLRVVFRNRPLETRPEGRLAHEAVLAAGAQGKFWQMHEAITAPHTGALTAGTLTDMAARLGLDKKKFAADLETHAFKDVIDRDLEDARRRDIRGTPVFFVNGIRIDGLQPVSYFQRFIDDELRRRTDR